MIGILVAVWLRDGAPRLARQKCDRKKLQHVSESSACPLEVHSLSADNFRVDQTEKIKRQIQIAKQSFRYSGKRKSL